MFCRILGAGNKNLNKIVEVFVKVLAHGSELADAETADKILSLLNQMQGSLPPQVSLLVCLAHRLIAKRSGFAIRYAASTLALLPLEKHRQSEPSHALHETPGHMQLSSYSLTYAQSVKS